MSIYKCSLCEYETKIKGNLNKHITNVCVGAEIVEDIIKVPCDICDKLFNGTKELKQHKNSCVKKTLIVNTFVNADEMTTGMEVITKMMKKIMADNEEMKKRLEQQDKKILMFQNRQVNKYELIQDGDEESLCTHSTEIQFIPINKKQVKYTLKEVNNDDDELAMTVKNQRSHIINGNISHDNYIETDDGTRFYYERSQRKDLKHASDLKIIFIKCCDSDAKYKNGDDYLCEKHIK